jgi:MFS family permease
LDRVVGVHPSKRLKMPGKSYVIPRDVGTKCPMDRVSTGKARERELHDVVRRQLASNRTLVWPLAFSNGITFIFSFVRGALTDSIGRRWAMIIPALIGACVAPFYPLTTDYTTLAIAFSIQGAFVGAIFGINPSYASERFPTEIRATAAGFYYHVGAIAGAFVPPILTYYAVQRHTGVAEPMLIGTVGGLISFVVTLFFSPETKGRVLAADLQVVPRKKSCVENGPALVPDRCCLAQRISD